MHETSNFETEAAEALRDRAVEIAVAYLRNGNGDSERPAVLDTIQRLCELAERTQGGCTPLCPAERGEAVLAAARARIELDRRPGRP